ncbi:MAG: PhaM family polyhydroxyalkanoate granule multifunctional regulatory protein [Burkholderiaceae bacterium]
MPDAPVLNRLAPGFDFLQDLVKNAGAALPHIGQWVAPTLNPEEIAKRIEELRTVQFWLEQNARMLGATIQALEVQRMTLSTLQSMNVQMGDLRDSLSARGGSDGPALASASSAAAPAKPKSGPKAGAGAAKPSTSVDPMQWWGALTQQFTELAAAAVKDSAKDAALGAAKALAGSALQQGLQVAGKSLKKAAGAATSSAKQAAAARRKPRAASGLR